jgi:hypothetical protein
MYKEKEVCLALSSHASSAWHQCHLSSGENLMVDGSEIGIQARKRDHMTRQKSEQLERDQACSLITVLS